MSRHDASLSAKQIAVTRRSLSSSKQMRTSSRTASVAYPVTHECRVEDPAQLGVPAPCLVDHLLLGPRVLDPQHQVADDLTVQLDHQGGRQPRGVGEGDPVGLQVGGHLGDPAAYGLEAPEAPRRLGVLGSGRSDSQPFGALGPGQVRERCSHAADAIRQGTHREQWRAQVAEAGKHPVQLGLVGDRAAQGRGPVAAVGKGQPAEQGGPVAVEVAADRELVGRTHRCSLTTNAARGRLPAPRPAAVTGRRRITHSATARLMTHAAPRDASSASGL